MGERLFSPKSLARVANAVEWEDTLVWYKDGSTNQEQFMKALSILWERWMREWSLPDFAQLAQYVMDKQWTDAFVHLVRGIPQRIQQLKGFYEGLWAGANPEWRASFWFPPGVLPAPVTQEDRVKGALAAMIQELTVMFTIEEEAEEARVWQKQA